MTQETTDDADDADDADHTDDADDADHTNDADDADHTDDADYNDGITATIGCKTTWLLFSEVLFSPLPLTSSCRLWGSDRSQRWRRAADQVQAGHDARLTL